MRDEFDHGKAEALVQRLKDYLAIGGGTPLGDLEIVKSTIQGVVYGPPRDVLEELANGGIVLLLAYVQELKKDYVWESAQLTALREENARLRHECQAAWGAANLHNRFHGKYKSSKQRWVEDWGQE